MRIPPFERYMGAVRLFGVFLLGTLIGAIIMNTLYAAQFEAYFSTRNALESKLEQYEQDIKGLNQYKNQHSVIKSIQLRIAEQSDTSSNFRLDKVSEAELIKRVKVDLSIFLGQSIFDIDSDAKFARKLLDRKVYSDVNGKDYRIALNTILLADNVLQVWMSATLYIRPPAS